MHSQSETSVFKFPNRSVVSYQSMLRYKRRHGHYLLPLNLLHELLMSSRRCNFKTYYVTDHSDHSLWVKLNNIPLVNLTSVFSGQVTRPFLLFQFPMFQDFSESFQCYMTFVIILKVEYTLLKFDHENKKVYNNLKAKEMLDVLVLEELNNPG